MAADGTTTELTGWRVFTGTARGAAHEAAGLPNQDAVATSDGPGAVVAAIVNAK